MKIIDLKHIEISNNGLIVNEIVFNSCITQHFIKYLSSNFPELTFHQGAFRINFSKGSIITGIEGENRIKILFSGHAKNSLHQLVKLIESYTMMPSVDAPI